MHPKQLIQSQTTPVVWKAKCGALEPAQRWAQTDRASRPILRPLTKVRAQPFGGLCVWGCLPWRSQLSWQSLSGGAPLSVLTGPVLMVPSTTGRQLSIQRWPKVVGNTKTLHVHHQMVSIKIRLIIWLYSLQPSAKDGEALYRQQKTRLGADCGSDRKFLIAKFRLKLKKVGKTTRPFRYDLNQIPYNYTVEVTNRFKGLDLMTECLKNYEQRFVTLYRRQGSRPSPRKINAKRQNGCLRRPYI